MGHLETKVAAFYGQIFLTGNISEGGDIQGDSIIERCRGLPIRLNDLTGKTRFGSYRRYPSISAWTLRDIPLTSATSAIGGLPDFGQHGQYLCQIGSIYAHHTGP